MRMNDRYTRSFRGHGCWPVGGSLETLKRGNTTINTVLKNTSAMIGG